MNSLFKQLKNSKITYIIFLFLLAKLLLIPVYKVVWWDSAVYIGMGKHLYAFGDAGLWEDSRPIIWPLLLGFLWKIGFNVVMAGRVMEIMLGSSCILLTYLIGRKLFSENAALLSSIFLALSPTFFFFSGIMLTETASVFFSLAAVYFFIGKKHLVSGLFFGIAFMARFLQLAAFIAALLIMFFYFDKKGKGNYIKIIIGFMIATAPFLIFNQISYNDALSPFLQQIFLSKNSGWLNYHPLTYYFLGLFKENFLYLLFIFGVSLAFKSKEPNKALIAAVFLIFLVFFNLIKQKEMRFLIVLLPYMYLLVSYPVMYFIDKTKNNILRGIALALVVLSLIFSIANTATYYKNESGKKNNYEALQNKFGDPSVNGKIWISSPIIAASSSKKIDKLMYYPLFNEKKKTELIWEADKADFIFIDSCDLACKPDDSSCESNKNKLLAHFKQQLKAAYSSKSGQCEQFVFQK